VVTVEEFDATARSVVQRAQERDLHLRLLGSMAFRFHCPKYQSYLDAMERELTDIDFVAAGRERREVRALFEELGYLEDRDVLVAMEGARYCYTHPSNKLGVDVFFDRLDYCHAIELGDRLDLDSPTISLADLVLEKTQIVQINEKDIKDLIVCFLEHELGSGERELIDGAYIADLLSKDWGFYYTATSNLEKVGRFLPRYEVLADNEHSLVDDRIGALVGLIEAAPKSIRWKARARVGTKVRWYREISAKESTF
jgi:hypothetical protein